MTSPDVVVVGGGVIGAACALELARRGARVTVFEREHDVGQACSYGNAGLVGSALGLPLATPGALREGMHSLIDRDAPLHVPLRPELVPWLARFALACRRDRCERALTALQPLGADSFQMHLAYAASGLRVGLTHRGAVLTWESDATFEAGVRELRAAGTSLTVLDRSQTSELVPALGDLPSALDQDIAHCDSRRWTLGVTEAAVELGAQVKRGTQVRRLRLWGGRVAGVETDDGDVTADVTVIAAGVWTDHLLSGTGVRLGLEGGKGYHVDLDPDAHDPCLPVYLQDAHVVATPLEGRLRLAGTLDFTGLDPSLHQRRADAVVASAARSLGGIPERSVQEVWAGIRPCASDGIPVIGRTARAGGLLIATGHAMIGLALAPVTGKLVAELASGGAPSHDISALSPDRFRRGRGARSKRSAISSLAAASPDIDDAGPSVAG